MQTTGVYFFEQQSWIGKKILFFLLCLLAFGPVGPGQTALAGGFDTSNDSLALLTGYGQSFPGWGLTTQRVETIDLVGRYNHVILNDLGSGWLRGYHSILLELPVHVVVSPDVSAMLAVNFLAAYTFTADTDVQPYIFGGGGPVYSFADVPGMGAEWNGNYQFGAGLDYNWQGPHHLLFEVRYHHISNGGAEEPNDPLNSIKLLVGFTF
jgi:hypothetical protein